MKLTGWTLEQIDATPAEFCDWILAFHRVEQEVAADAR